MSKFLAKVKGLVSKPLTREIDGVEFNFYPVRFGRVLNGEVRAILAPLFGAIQVVLRPRSVDQEVIEDVDQVNAQVARHIRPASPELLETRRKHDREIFEEALDKLTAEDTRLQIGIIICDCLRDEFDGHPSEEEVEEFINNLEIPQFMQFVRAVVDANGKLFGELGKKMGARFQEMLNRSPLTETEETTEVSPDPSFEDTEAEADQESSEKPLPQNSSTSTPASDCPTG